MKKGIILIITVFALINAVAQSLVNDNSRNDSKYLLVKSKITEPMKDYFQSFNPMPGITSSVAIGGFIETKAQPVPVQEEFNNNDSTRALIQLVKEGAELIRVKGESSFRDFQVPNSHWRRGEMYIFVLDPYGNMIVHPDPELEGKNQLELKDINGRPIIRGLIEAATDRYGRSEGWYHYQWFVPGGVIPRWKSSYVRSVKAPSGKEYIVGCGVYNDQMEREFVIDAVKAAVARIEKMGTDAFPLFHDPTGPFMVKDAYIFVIDNNGIEIVNPAFPMLQGRNIMDLKDTRGKFLIRDMFNLVKNTDAGWVNYMWPKPGESVSTQKSTYVSKARMGDKWVLVGCGVYMDEGPVVTSTEKKMTANELRDLVREAATIFEKEGEKAFPEFRKVNSKWLHNGTYFFVWTQEGTRYFHASNPSIEGLNVSGIKDIIGRPWGRMFLDAVSTPQGEGWAHYMYPEPGTIFPTWKSSFVKRVTFPSGKQYVIGCGVYNMQMNREFIEDVVNRASDLVAQKGKDAFPLLRDKTGPYMFMDIYVFVDNPDGVELVNPGTPAVEGKNLKNMKDAHGKFAARDYIEEAMKKGSAWVDFYWYRPGENKPAHKYAYVRKVVFGNEIFIVGSGYYVDDEVAIKLNDEIQKAHSTLATSSQPGLK